MSTIGNLFIFSAPSGAGKTSLIKALVEKLGDLYFSVSHTTRAKRSGEVNGIDYHFVTEDEFFSLQQKSGFLESAKVFDHYYGTSVKWIETTLRAGKDIALEIDWQGARQIKEKMPESLKVFILPPSKEVLLQRLTKREQNNKEVIEARMSKAIDEILHYVEYDYLVVNDNFDQTVFELESIIKACRSKFSVQAKSLQELINNLVNKQE